MTSTPSHPPTPNPNPLPHMQTTTRTLRHARSATPVSAYFERATSTAPIQPADVEECELGWLVPCTSSHAVYLLPRHRHRDSGKSYLALVQAGEEEPPAPVVGGWRGKGVQPLLHRPVALAHMPHVGLVVRERGIGRFLVREVRPREQLYVKCRIASICEDCTAA
jgi:hypothetical protein